MVDRGLLSVSLAIALATAAANTADAAQTTTVDAAGTAIVDRVTGEATVEDVSATGFGGDVGDINSYLNSGGWTFNNTTKYPRQTPPAHAGLVTAWGQCMSSSPGLGLGTGGFSIAIGLGSEFDENCGKWVAELEKAKDGRRLTELAVLHGFDDKSRGTVREEASYIIVAQKDPDVAAALDAATRGTAFGDRLRAEGAGSDVKVTNLTVVYKDRTSRNRTERDFSNCHMEKRTREVLVCNGKEVHDADQLARFLKKRRAESPAMP